MPFDTQPVVSDRCRRAVQDYTALNTILSAIESMELANRTGGPRDSLASAILHAFVACDEKENVRLRINCPLGQRALALGMLRCRTDQHQRNGYIATKVRPL